jgi:hypothetical protein
MRWVRPLEAECNQSSICVILKEISRKGIMRTIEDIDFDGMVAQAQTNLNDSYRHYQTGVRGVPKGFIEIKLHICIFQYDSCIEMLNVIRNRPIGFAVGVALKGLVLRLFEFDLTLRGVLIPQLAALAVEHDVDLGNSIKLLKREWKTELMQLEKWKDIRNEAAGHYDRDIKKQVEALESLSVDGVLTVAIGFLSFAQGIFKILRDAGTPADAE